MGIYGGDDLKKISNISKNDAGDSTLFFRRPRHPKYGVMLYLFVISALGLLNSPVAEGRQMPKKQDEKLKNLRCSIVKDWKFSGNLIVDFVLSRIEGFRREDKWNPNFDEENLVNHIVDIVIDIGVGFEEYLGRFGKDYFFHILDNLTMMAIDEEIEHRRKFEQKKEKKFE